MSASQTQKTKGKGKADADANKSSGKFTVPATPDGATSLLNEGKIGKKSGFEVPETPQLSGKVDGAVVYERNPKLNIPDSAVNASKQMKEMKGDKPVIQQKVGGIPIPTKPGEAGKLDGTLVEDRNPKGYIPNTAAEASKQMKEVVDGKNAIKPLVTPASYRRPSQRDKPVL